MGFPTKLATTGACNLLFQSLVGIYGFSDLPVSHRLMVLPVFQSLVGIYGFSDLRPIPAAHLLPRVSIPGRDLWVFRLIIRSSEGVPASFNPW